MVILQMLHVELFVISTLQTFDPQVCQRNVTDASVFCHKLFSGIKNKKKQVWVHFQIANSDAWKNAHMAPIIPNIPDIPNTGQKSLFVNPNR